MKRNLSKDEVAALKNLRSNNDMYIMRVDKGNTTVILNTQTYHGKMYEHLTSGGSYRKLHKDPSTIIIGEVMKAT